jgi:predicted DNA-binding protein with PD1-like motif
MDYQRIPRIRGYALSHSIPAHLAMQAPPSDAVPERREAGVGVAVPMQALRLNPGDDLRQALDAALAASGQRAGFVVAGIGSLLAAQLRYAGAPEPTAFAGDIEILTLSGSLSADGSHLHMSMSDARGQVYGGHVSPGCIVRTTAEIVVAFLPEVSFGRALDAATGYAELTIGRVGG